MPSATTAGAPAPSLISKVISHADKLPLVRIPLAGWTSKTNEASLDQGDVVYYKLSGSPRGSYAASPPPPYEKVAPGSSPSMLAKILSASGLSRPSASLNNQFNIDTKQIDNAVTLINIASEMDQSGSHQMAFDLYMMGLDRMLSAFPLETNPNMKRALEDKIREFRQEKRLNLDLPPADVTELTSELEPVNATTTLSELIVNVLVYGAVTLKKSPVPYLFASVIAYAKAGLQLVDDTCQIRKRTRDIASHGMAKAAEFDRQYEIQHKVTESVNAFYAAVAKANLAYAETPGFKEEVVPAA
ncbi:hypothetical protein BJV82DRAFT_617840 [Fennellomyces sp. T-0311]|nr:hypothetical protein BJV82DRAFT_617840 [Fennellomyces sp. T-0311]